MPGVRLQTSPAWKLQDELEHSEVRIHQKEKPCCCFFWHWHFLQLGEVTPLHIFFVVVFFLPFPWGLSCLSICYVQPAHMCTYFGLRPLRNIWFLFFSQTPIDQESFTFCFGYFLTHGKSEFIAIRLFVFIFCTSHQIKLFCCWKSRPDLSVMQALTAGFCCRMCPRRLGSWEAAPRITFAFTLAQFYGIAGPNQIWCAVSAAARWKRSVESAWRVAATLPQWSCCCRKGAQWGLCYCLAR